MGLRFVFLKVVGLWEVFLILFRMGKDRETGFGIM